MLSKSQIKLIASLNQKKYRNKHGLFIVEGKKGVNEFLNSDFKLHSLYYTNEFSETLLNDQSYLISEVELKKISNLKTPNSVLGLFQIPDEVERKHTGLILAIDGVNDPGNLGTIIRLCDWFGLSQLVCSENTVDCFNSKVVQSTMGSLTRVHIVYKDLGLFLSETSLPVYGAMMDGTNVYEENLSQNAILVLGNEANGISDKIKLLLSNNITIPRFGSQQKTESLNVATAAAILLSEFRRS